jgi:drug/metabolite transporter (DMT)-like permease
MRILQKLAFMLHFLYLAGILLLFVLVELDWLRTSTTTGKVIALSAVLVVSALGGHYCWAQLYRKNGK